MSIVIIDDSATNLIVLKYIAASGGERPVVTFSQPAEARNYLSENTADLVIVDCEMPGLDGISLVNQVRQFRHHADTPIIMVTNHTEGQIRHAALASGVTEFLSKPVDSAELKLRIRNLLRLKTHRAVA